MNTKHNLPPYCSQTGSIRRREGNESLGKKSSIITSLTHTPLMIPNIYSDESNSTRSMQHFYIHITEYHAHFTCTCLQSAPRAGKWIFLKVMGHLREIFTPVCWMLSSLLLWNHLLTAGEKQVHVRCNKPWKEHKKTREGGRESLNSLLAIQCSAGSNLFLSNPWRTEPTDGRWTSCSTNMCD